MEKREESKERKVNKESKGKRPRLLEPPNSPSRNAESTYSSDAQYLPSNNNNSNSNSEHDPRLVNVPDMAYMKLIGDIGTLIRKYPKTYIDVLNIVVLLLEKDKYAPVLEHTLDHAIGDAIQACESSAIDILKDPKMDRATKIINTDAIVRTLITYAFNLDRKPHYAVRYLYASIYIIDRRAKYVGHEKGDRRTIRLVEEWIRFIRGKGPQPSINNTRRWMRGGTARRRTKKQTKKPTRV